MKPPPEYGHEVTLVPLSGIQFLDFAARIDRGNKIEGFNWDDRWFAERSVIEDGEPQKRLLQLRSMEGDLFDSITGAAVDQSDAYSVRISDVVSRFVGRWTPIPYFRIIGTDANRADVHDRGPTNWARIYLAKLELPDEKGNTHRAVIAFDTDTQQANRTAESSYVMPTRQDATTEDKFSFAGSPADLNWFVNQLWMDDWLTTGAAAAPRPPKQSSNQDEEGPPRDFDYICHYVVLIQVLAAVLPVPRIRLIDIFSEQLNYKPIPVDLIVDVGNSRTCGILIEDQGNGAGWLDISQSDPLSLRDLGRPEIVHSDSFQSRIEFSRAYFGEEGISRRSGRKRSFQWPSLVRVGPEAVRLSVAGSGTEGATGMSSPKRYLWDGRPIRQVWRMRRPERHDTEVVSGAMLRFLTESGELLGRKKRHGASRDMAQPAIRPKFSRSSLFMMLMTEVLAQTIAAINSPERRGRKNYTDVPRYLRNIIMTLPPATPLAERRIMAERVDDAIALVWKSLGWSEEPQLAETVAPPKVKINLDEATATQLVYLYTEVVKKYGREPRSFFQIAGRPRAEYGSDPSLRIASIDIGGGTSDLIVVTYRVQDKTKRTIQPEQNFREGFRVAGDDIVHSVIANNVLHSIEQALGVAGLAEPRAFLRGIVGADRGSMSEQERQFRRRFVLQLLEPAALVLLGLMEDRPNYAENVAIEQPMGATWKVDLGGARSIAAEFDALARRVGARDFSLADVVIQTSSDEINTTVRTRIGPALNIFAEVVASLECDVLLLSGRPSRLPVVSDILISTLAVRPDRVVPMHRYRAGEWYPFRDTLDRITDPKTTVAVGALLSSFAEGQIEDFKVGTQHLTVRSTARYIGEISPHDKISNNDLLFRDIDLEATGSEPREAVLVAETQTTTIGFRQLPLERWPASPLYVVELTQAPDAHGPLAFPIKVKLSQGRAADTGRDASAAEAAREDFVVVDFEDAKENRPNKLQVECRLQTMKNSSGYWLDTGIISEY
ncbi:virulence factor SrfB [Rhizobium brockwellii]|uniref:virulence factor SrfB n=1 Tax=Rhizobium brockwellii TaxID=3019932 RepID=UPI003F971AA2